MTKVDRRSHRIKRKISFLGVAPILYRPSACLRLHAFYTFSEFTVHCQNLFAEGDLNISKYLPSCMLYSPGSAVNVTLKNYNNYIHYKWYSKIFWTVENPTPYKICLVPKRFAKDHCAPTAENLALPMIPYEAPRYKVATRYQNRIFRTLKPKMCSEQGVFRGCRGMAQCYAEALSSNQCGPASNPGMSWHRV